MTKLEPDARTGLQTAAGTVFSFPCLPFREVFPISIWIEKHRLFHPFAKLDSPLRIKFYSDSFYGQSRRKLSVFLQNIIFEEAQHLYLAEIRSAPLKFRIKIDVLQSCHHLDLPSPLLMI